MVEAKDGYGYSMPLFDTINGLPFADEQLFFPRELGAWVKRLSTPGGYSALLKELEEDAQELRILAMTTEGKVAVLPVNKGLYEAWNMGAVVEDCDRVFFAGVDSRDVVRFVAIVSEESLASLRDKWDVPLEELSWLSLRHEAAHLESADCASAGRALALLRWQENNQYCSRCGGQMGSENGGEIQRCVQCDRLEYPRQDPAVIVLITDEEDRILLGHNRSWTPAFMSLIAGFVEAGETPEHAVVREAKEEANLDVEDVRYFATQPWPFPRSVMMGFTASVNGTPTPQPDMDEVDAMRWVTRDELMALVESGELEIPTHTAIARKMIDMWLHHLGRAS